MTSPATSPSASLPTAWARFWFTPVDASVLHLLRVATGALLLYWLLPLSGNVEAFFGLQGWFDVAAYRDAARLTGDRGLFQWSLVYLCGENMTLLRAAYWGSVAVVVLFTLGILPRLTAIATWAIVISFTANPAIRYGADLFLVLPAFYLMLGYVTYGQWSWRLTPAARLLGTPDAFIGSWFKRESANRSASLGANLSWRLFQVHFAAAVFFLGIYKLQFADWWSGVALWYPLHPPMETTLASVRSTRATANAHLFFWSLVQYGMLAWQIGFPLFAWRQGWLWRTILLGGGLLACAGSLFVYREPLYGPTFLVCCLGYLTTDELCAWGARLRRTEGVLEHEKGKKKSARKVKIEV